MARAINQQESAMSIQALPPEREIPHTATKTQCSQKIIIILKKKKPQWITYRKTMIWITSDFLSKAMEARSCWNKDFTVLKGKNYQSKILYPVEISFRNNGEIH